MRLPMPKKLLLLALQIKELRLIGKKQNKTKN